jgi:excisionase family DNA binding protein
MSDEQLLTIRDVVIEMGVNEKTVRRWIQNGELHATKDMFGRYKITRDALNDFRKRREERYNEPKDKPKDK